jgi:signal transduction histidine kinase
LLTNSIAQLSDISKSLNADIIIQHGLLKAIEDELQRIRQAGLFTLDYELTGTPVYMDNQKELIIFRIIQESFNNIIKHAESDNAKLVLHYNMVKLVATISDDGMGFDTELSGANHHAGLKNMETRIKVLKGEMNISSRPGKGTVLSFNIPFE